MRLMLIGVWALAGSTIEVRSCDLISLANAEEAISIHRPGYTMQALELCPAAFCETYGKRILIFNSTPNVKKVHELCDVEAVEVHHAGR